MTQTWRLTQGGATPRWHLEGGDPSLSGGATLTGEGFVLRVDAGDPSILLDLHADPRLGTNNDRIRERAWLLPRIEALFAGMSRDAALEGCGQAGIPFAPVARPEGLFDDPHLNAGGYLVDSAVAEGVRAKLPRLPLTMAGVTPGLRNDPPEIGSDTRNVLSGLGYSEEAIISLAAAGVIGLAREETGSGQGE